MNTTLQGIPVYDSLHYSSDAGELARSGGAVITEKGRPAVLVLDISADDPEAIIQAVRRARAKAAFESMRRTAQHNGYMQDAEIDSEIASARQEKRGR